MTTSSSPFAVFCIGAPFALALFLPARKTFAQQLTGSEVGAISEIVMLPGHEAEVLRYLQTHPIAEKSNVIAVNDFDGTAELWFDSLAGLEAVLTSETYKTTVFPDELTFLDHKNTLVQLGTQADIMGEAGSAQNPGPSTAAPVSRPESADMVPFRNLPGRSHGALNATLEEKIATSVDFKYWTGVDADVTVMRKALEKALSL